MGSTVAATQKERPIAVASPLGEDALLFHSLAGNEGLSGLFDFELDLLSDNEEVKFEDILGQNVTVRLNLPDDKERYFNGYVSRFSQAGRFGDYAWYRATVRPWLWFLTRTSDCRIFQKKTVPEILKDVFSEFDFADYEDALGGSYRTWDYCVQYRETDFNFVSRLMEQEGIYYFFKHENGKHTLVLADSYGAHERPPGYEKISYYPPTANVVREKDCVIDWAISQEIQPGVYCLTDFNFETPKADMLVKAAISRKHDKADLEIYDYPGEYPKSQEGEAYIKARIQELHAQYEHVRGSGNVRGLYAGSLFELAGYPRQDQNREYLVVSVNHELRSNQYGSGEEAGKPTYAGNFVAIDSKQPYRPPRVTPKPVVQGPQTAIVVGKSGEEIWTDDYGRVMVQFHWDRQGKKDENSSCWVRVAQVWAGQNWGGIQIPRIGQEVIVEFLEGDPDHPIITGRVYNADSMPPYKLPDNRTQSGIKSRSSKGGTGENFNEIRFEDKKGEEQLYIHAEKNQDIVVENDETHKVGHDRSKDVGNDERTTIGSNRTESVGKDESITIGQNRSENVAKNESISIGESRSEKVGKDEAISIGDNRTENVGKKETVSIGEDRFHNVGKNDALEVGKKLTISAGEQIVLVTGSASLTMKKNGDIVLEGKNIKLEGSGKIDVKASSDVTIKGSKIKQN